MRSVVSWPTSLSALGRLKNQTTSFFGLQPLVAHADVGDGPIYVPAYRSGERPFDVKLDPGARRRMRIVSWCTTFTTAIASRWRGRILAETLRQSGNCAVTNKRRHQIRIFGDHQHMGGLATGCYTCRAGFGCAAPRPPKALPRAQKPKLRQQLSRPRAALSLGLPF